MKADFKLVHLPRNLRENSWGTLFRNWANLLDKYAVAEAGQPPDYAYWYGERPLTGLLATAAWKLSDGWGLEEFASPRGSGSSKRLGRGDLWLGTNSGKFTVEAKITWPSSDWRYAKSNVLQRLREAKRQLQSLNRKYKYGDLIALCYVVPQPVAKRSSAQVIDEMFSKLPEYFARDPYFVATYRYKRRVPQYSTRYYPGVIIVAELLTRDRDE